MDYKLLCTKCEQIALKHHSYVDKSTLVEKSSEVSHCATQFSMGGGKEKANVPGSCYAILDP